MTAERLNGTVPAVRVAGVLCLAGVWFISQELVRIWLDLRQSAFFARGSHGWLDLSGAATPGVYLYAVAHLWLPGVLWRRSLFLGTVADRVIFVLLLVGVGVIHALVQLTPLRGWTIRPALW